MAQYRMNKANMDNWRLSRIEEELEKLEITSGSESEGYKSKENSPAPPDTDQDIYSKVVILPAYRRDSEEEQMKEAVKKLTEKYDSLGKVRPFADTSIPDCDFKPGTPETSPRRGDPSQTVSYSGYSPDPSQDLPTEFPPPMDILSSSTLSPVCSRSTVYSSDDNLILPSERPTVPLPQGIMLSNRVPQQMPQSNRPQHFILSEVPPPGSPNKLPTQGIVANRPEQGMSYNMPSSAMYSSFPPPEMMDSMPIYGRSNSLPRSGHHRGMHALTGTLPPQGVASVFPPQSFFSSFPPQGASHRPGGRLSDQDVLQVEMFYRSHKTEVFVCASMADMYYGSVKANSPESPNMDQWVFAKEGVPVLVLDSGESRRRRKLFMVLAEKGTGFILWKDCVNHLTNYRTPHPNFHSMHLSNDHTRLAGFSFDDPTAAAEFYQKIHGLTCDPTDDILNLSGSGKSRKKKDDKHKSKHKFKAPNKADISSPCCFTHITKLDRTDGMSILGTSVPSSPARDTKRLSTVKLPKVSHLLPNDLDA